VFNPSVGATTETIMNGLSTVSGSSSVSFSGASVTPSVGTFVSIPGPITIGGLTLSGSYQVVTNSIAGMFAINAGSPATGTVTNGGGNVTFTVNSALDRNYISEVFAWPNSYFNEISWFYPTIGSNGVITNYVKFNLLDNTWDFGAWNRTAGIDQSVCRGPIAAAGDTGYLVQHDMGGPSYADNDGVAMDSWIQTGWFKLSEGSNFMSLYRILPDFILSPGAQVLLTVYVVNYIGDTPTVLGPYTVASSSDYVIVRGRGRYASIKIESTGLGSFWRLGKLLVQVQPAGRR